METATEIKPCAAEALLGTQQEIRHGGRVYKGTITKWRHGTGIIEKMSAPQDGSRPLAYPTFDVLLKPEDGSKAVWIKSFKDTNNPFPSELWLGDEETLNRRVPHELLRNIRRTLFGYHASEPIQKQAGWEKWVLAAGIAFHDVCELLEKHFSDAD